MKPRQLRPRPIFADAIIRHAALCDDKTTAVARSCWRMAIWRLRYSPRDPAERVRAILLFDVHPRHTAQRTCLSILSVAEAMKRSEPRAEAAQSGERGEENATSAAREKRVQSAR